MASITVTALSNGVTLGGGETIVGMLELQTYPIAYPDLVTAYIYYTSIGKIWYQADAGTSATLAHTPGFAITCAAAVNMGGNTIFLGGVGGAYVFGTISDDGLTISLANMSSGTDTFTSVIVDAVAFNFLVGTDVGVLYQGDMSLGGLTLYRTLALPSGFPVGATAYVSKIAQSVDSGSVMVCCKASTNNPAGDLANESLVYVATYDFNASDYTAFVRSTLSAVDITLGALGVVSNSAVQLADSSFTAKISRYVVIGMGAVGTTFQPHIYVSSDGSAWNRTFQVDQVNAFTVINSLCFKSWLFVAGKASGFLSMSSDGIVWEDMGNPLLAADVIEVVAA